MMASLNLVVLISQWIFKRLHDWCPFIFLSPQISFVFNHAKIVTSNTNPGQDSAICCHLLSWGCSLSATLSNQPYHTLHFSLYVGQSTFVGLIFAKASPGYVVNQIRTLKSLLQSAEWGSCRMSGSQISQNLVGVPINFSQLENLSQRVKTSLSHLLHCRVQNLVYCTVTIIATDKGNDGAMLRCILSESSDSWMSLMPAEAFGPWEV